MQAILQPTCKKWTDVWLSMSCCGAKLCWLCTRTSSSCEHCTYENRYECCVCNIYTDGLSGGWKFCDDLYLCPKCSLNSRILDSYSEEDEGDEEDEDEE